MSNKQVLLIMAAFALTFSACKKSDDQQSPGSAIVGKWNEVALHESTTINGTTTEISSKPGGFTKYDYATFDQQHSAFFSRGGGNPFDPGQAAPAILYISKYTYSINGATLTLTSEGNGTTFNETITKLDDKNLVLHAVSANGSDKHVTDSYFVKD